MKKVILFSLMLVSYIGLSQTEKNKQNTVTNLVIIENLEDKLTDDHVYVSVETMPEYPGGINAFREFIAANYKTPKANKDIKGSLIVQFVIETDGSMSNIKVVRDLGYGTGFEAVRVLKLAEKWKPGIQDGKPVRVNYTLPLTIKIKAKK